LQATRLRLTIRSAIFSNQLEQRMLRVEHAGRLNIPSARKTPWPQDHGIEEVGADGPEPLTSRM